MTDNTVNVIIRGDASGATAATRTVRRDLDEVRTGALSAGNAVDQLKNTLAGLAGAAALTALVKSSLDAAMQMERLQKMFTAASGSAALAAKEMEYVRSVTTRMGLDLVTTAESYGKFLAAIRGTSLEGEKGRKVFESVSNASAALGLRADETSGIFNALQQMMSKGKVQAEELRGQLGERLPGAFKLAADAMGMTTAELDKALKDGKVLADDLLPKLADQLDKKFGTASLSAANQLALMNNALFESKAAFGSALIPAFTDAVKSITPAIGKLKEFIGGLQILSIKMFAFADKTKAWVDAGGLLGMLSGKNRASFSSSITQINANAESTIGDLMKRYQPQGSDYSAAEKLRQAQNKATKPLTDDKAAAKAAKEAATWATTIATLRKEIDALQPGLDRHDKAILDTTLKYDELIKKKGADIAKLQVMKAEHLSAIITRQQIDKAIKDSKQEYDDLKASAEALTAAEKALWTEIANTIKQVEALQPGAAITALGQQIENIYSMADKIPDMAEKAETAVDALLKFKEDAQLIEDINNDLIDDPYQRQLAQIETFYDRKLELIETERNALLDLQDASRDNLEQYLKYQKKIEQLDDKEGALKKKQIKDVAQTQADSLSSQLSMASNYAGVAGQMFQVLADTQDQASREGFESAKAFNTAGAIMSTAAAIMSQLATPGPIGWAKAALAAATGAIQIATIQSTSFGGGGTAPTVSAGSFQGGSALNGGTVGGSIGNRITSIQDSATEDSLRAIIPPLENASLAIGKAADGLTKIADLFADGSMLSMLTGSLVTPAGIGESKTTLSSVFSQALKMTFNPFGSASQSPENAMASLSFGLPIPMTAISKAISGGPEFQTGQGYVIRAIDGLVSTLGYVTSQKPGGLFGSTKNSIGFAGRSDIDAAIQPYISSIVATISRAVVGLGTTVDESKLSSPGGVVMTMGMTQDQINDQMEAVLNTISNDMAKAVVGLEQFAYYGENAFDALVRLIVSLQGVNEQLELIGATLIESTLKGGDAAYRLMDMMGGAEAFAEAVDTYFTTMFSDTEQQAQLAAQAQRQVNVAFAEMQTAVPTTREEFRNLVNSLDLTTDRGAALFGGLMNISEAFGTVADAAEAAAAQLKTISDGMQDLYIRQLIAQGDAGISDAASNQLAAQRELEQAITDNMGDAYITRLLYVQGLERAMAQESSAVTDDLKTAFSTEKTRLTDLYNAELTALNTRLADTKTLVTTLTGYINKLTSARKSMVLADAVWQRDQYSSAQSLLAAVLVQARGGDLSGIAGLDDTLSILTKQGADAYANSTDYKRDFWQTSNSIAELETLAGKQLSDAEQAVLLAQTQVDLLKTNHDAQLGALDAQLNALMGINTSVVSLADAIAAFTGITKKLPATTDPIEGLYNTVLGRTSDAGGYDYWSNQYASGTSLSTIATAMTNSQENQINQLYTSVLGRSADASGAAYWQSQLSSGMSTAAITAAMMASDEYKALNSYAVGSAYIPYDQTANIHQGEMIIDRQSADIMRRYGIQSSGSADNAELVAEVRALNARIDRLTAATGEVSKATQKTAKLIDQWDGDGMPEVRAA